MPERTRDLLTYAITLIVALAIIALAAVVLGAATADAEVTTFEDCAVTSVTDGDTFKCRYLKPNGYYSIITVRVRLIDTPEASRWYHKGSGTWRPAECWGATAKGKARYWLDGATVTVESHGLDGNGRHLGEVILASGQNFGHIMLRQGHAAIYKANGYLDAEDPLSMEAKDAGRGMWGGCANPPGHNGRHPLPPPEPQAVLPEEDSDALIPGCEA